MRYFAKPISMVSFVGASGRTPLIGRAPLAPTCKARKSNGRGNPPGCPMSGGSAIRPYLLQRRRWIFYETIYLHCHLKGLKWVSRSK